MISSLTAPSPGDELADSRAHNVVVNGAISGWQAVTNSAPQGPVLGPDPFYIFIDDLDAGVEHIFSKFADDTKLEGAVDSLKGQEALQKDQKALEHWATISGMKFNKGNCWVLYLGQSNARHMTERQAAGEHLGRKQPECAG